MGGWFGLFPTFFFQKKRSLTGANDHLKHEGVGSVVYPLCVEGSRTKGGERERKGRLLMNKLPFILAFGNCIIPLVLQWHAVNTRAGEMEETEGRLYTQLVNISKGLALEHFISLHCTV